MTASVGMKRAHSPACPESGHSTPSLRWRPCLAPGFTRDHCIDCLSLSLPGMLKSAGPCIILARARAPAGFSLSRSLSRSLSLPGLLKGAGPCIILARAHAPAGFSLSLSRSLSRSLSLPGMLKGRRSLHHPCTRTRTCRVLSLSLALSPSQAC